MHTTIHTEEYEQIAEVDGTRYLVLHGVYRQSADGLTFYCTEHAWPTSDAAKLAERDAQIARLQAELATLRHATTTTNGHAADDDAPVACPICGESFQGRRGLKVHMPKKHQVRLSDYEAQHGHVSAQANGHPHPTQREPTDDKEDSQYADNCDHH